MYEIQVKKGDILAEQAKIRREDRRKEVMNHTRLVHSIPAKRRNELRYAEGVRMTMRDLGR